MRVLTWKGRPTQPAGGARRLGLAWRSWSALALGLVLALGLGLALRPAAPAQAAPLAPDFTLPAATGSAPTMSLRALRGHPVLLNFFETTCQPCQQEMPVLRQTAQAYRAKGVVVLGVATLGDTAAAARQMAATAHLGYPIVADNNQAVAWRYGVSGVPVSFFLDAQGHLRGQYIGPLGGQTVRAGLAQAGALRCASCGQVAPPTLVTAAHTPATASALSADTIFSPARPAPTFAVRDQNGRLITPGSLRGKVVALTFISAQCREQCPLIGRALSQVAHALGRDARRFAIVAISVDPEVDMPLATRAFASESGWRGTDWHYLSAPRDVLARIWSAYGIYVPPPAPIFKPGQQIIHEAYLYLLDQRGRERALYDVPLLTPRLTASVRALLNGQ